MYISWNEFSIRYFFLSLPIRLSLSAHMHATIHTCISSWITVAHWSLARLFHMWGSHQSLEETKSLIVGNSFELDD